jgi:7,8-dihydropterin-6-yl-methyl-4-(beta-D-ribofuranosyl)aminobenzene 5'-phosphate synthase
MRLTWLVNDLAGPGDDGRPPLVAEHGLAFWIETPDGCVLFDTGGSGEVLLGNMRRLGVDPADADALVLSHAHDDHSGGLEGMLPLLRPGIPLYAHPTLFTPRYSAKQGRPVSRGMRLGAEELGRRLSLRLEATPQEVLPGVWTTGEIAERPEPEGRSPYHQVVEGGQYLPDPYADDMSMVLRVEGGVFLLCGCCHAGLLNTLSHVQRVFERPIVTIAGGTHLVNADANHLQQVQEVMLEIESVQRVYLNHCSGQVAFHSLLLALGPDVVRPCPAGTCLDF